MPIDHLREVVADWNRHRKDIAGMSDKTGDWRQKTVQYRRLLQADITKLAAAIRALDEHAATKADAASLRGELSTLRSCVAAHQATWPVVTIDLDDADYIRSVAGLRTANNHFERASSDILARLKRSVDRPE